jgi:glycosyltransferase involved in cell wall biosynthesis
MRVVQIIDSLEAGGAERMAVNYANALAERISFSGLITTRKEGQLASQIDEKVSYLFLEKKKKIDLKAVLRLREYIKKNKVEIVHAHSSSFFIAILVKLTLFKVKILWHDHYGSRVNESRKKNRILVFSSVFFSSIFAVNLQLQEWSRKNLLCRNVIFIPNFTRERKEKLQITKLRGIDGKRIVFLANLKKPKNHILVVRAFTDLKLYETGWSLHLIGRNYFDSYSEELKVFIKSSSLENHIHLYGEKSDIKYILSQASIGILASTEEGFPVALLEYALESLAVVSTNVGYCSKIIKNGFSGLLFDPKNDFELKLQLEKITQDGYLRETMASNFKAFVTKEYSEEEVMKSLISVYKK